MGPRNVCLILLVAMLVSCSSTPSVRIHPRRSEDSIRKVILDHTPLGSSPNQVLTFIQTQLHHEGSPILLDDRPAEKSIRDSSGRLKNDRERLGSKSINDVEVGWHWASFPLLPLINFVYVSWAFDQNNNLIDVIVEKQRDGL